MPFKSIFKEIIILLLVAVTSALIVNSISPKGIAFVGEWDIRKGVISSKPKNSVIVQEIEIQNVFSAKEVFDSGKALFIDARSSEIYKEGHIKGAFSMPITMFDEMIEQFISEYSETSFLVTYCSGRECSDSHELAQYLMDSGYTNVKVFIDGFPEWKKKGYPVESNNSIDNQ